TVSGFSFHPLLPMAATASGHRRFVPLEESDEDLDLSLRDDENCASVWSFPVYTAEDYAANTDPILFVSVIYSLINFYDQQTSAALSRASAAAFKEVFRDVQNLIYSYAARENSFLSMLKAGSEETCLSLCSIVCVPVISIH
ncbi:hypothetical protein Tco_1115363, partial [Tanacetum coccineum]